MPELSESTQPTPSIQPTPPPQPESITATVGGIAGDQLGQYIERIERLEEEKAELGQDIRDLYQEAKGNGFDPKVMRQIVRLRKKESHEIDEEEAMLLLYKQALGMMPTTIQ